MSTRRRKQSGGLVTGLLALFLTPPLLLIGGVCLLIFGLLLAYQPGAILLTLALLVFLFTVLAVCIGLGIVAWHMLTRKQPQPTIQPEQRYPVPAISVPVYQPKAIKPEPVYLPGSKRVAGWQNPDGHIIWESSQQAN